MPPYDDPDDTHDPREPHGTVYDDPALHDDSDTDSDELASQEYADRGRGPGECESCGRAIPPAESRCADCADITVADAEPESDSDAWQLSRVVFAAVPANVEEVALAKASAALTYRRTDHDHVRGRDERVMLVEVFDGEVPATFTTTWGDLPAAVAWESDAGERLREHIVSKTVWLGDAPEYVRRAVERSSSVDHACLYTEYGEAVTDRERLDALDAGDKSVWLVPGLAYQYRPRRPTQARECVGCETTTTHEFVGWTPTRDPTDREGEPEWMCRVCGLSQSGDPPEPDRKMTDDSDHVGRSPAELEAAHDRELFEQAVETYLDGDSENS